MEQIVEEVVEEDLLDDQICEEVVIEEEFADDDNDQDVDNGEEEEEEVDEDNDDNEEIEENGQLEDNEDVEDDGGEEIEAEAEESLGEEEESQTAQEVEEEDAEEVAEAQEEDDEEEEEQEVDSAGIYQWSAFTGLRVKSFSSEELVQFRKPFELGWSREVVLRGTVTSSGKKIGDVYYFSPDKKHKLRSYVNMQDFLKRTNSPLTPANFTFARQPVFRPPQEIVRHAMQRGERGDRQSIVGPPEMSPSKDSQSERSTRNSTNSESEDREGAGGQSVAEGRAKRKRVAPSRFEDENYEEVPFKKKSLGAERGKQNGQDKPKGPLSLQEKRRQLQHQLLQQVHEKIKEEAPTPQMEEQEPELMSFTPAVEMKEVEEAVEEEIKKEEKEEKKEPKSARKSITREKEDKDEKKDSGVDQSDENKTEDEDKKDEPQTGSVPGAPCSMHCPGRRGMLPNLMCSRCFCLYHLDCVPGGVFLEQPRVFVCPNCLSPEDKEQKTDQNGDETKTVLVTTPLLIQQPLTKPRSTFAPILPKPPQLQQNALYQQMFQQKMRKMGASGQVTVGETPWSAPNSQKNKGQYRVATGPNGHSMIVKDTKKPKIGKKVKDDQRPQIRPLVDHQPLLYRPERPIAPIAPIKLTPQQIERQLRHLLSGSGKRRGYRSWVERRSQGVTSLLSPYQSLNQVLQYLTVKDLVRLRQVSRVFTQLSGQPFLWRNIRLKMIQLNDWLFLAKNIIEANNSYLLDFEGVRPPPHETPLDFWRNFSAIVDYLKSVHVLRFGTCPTFVLEEVSSAAITDNPYNSFSSLKELSVKNLFEEDNEQGPCRLDFLADIHALQSLKTLSISSKHGFAKEDNTVDLLEQVFAKMNLQTLHITSLKDFHSSDFRFLTSLPSLRQLSIGSCSNWFESSSAFESLAALTLLQELRLQDIVLDDRFELLLESLERLSELESLTIENLKIESEGVVERLSPVLKDMQLKSLHISSSDPKTNGLVVDLLKRSDAQKILWKVESLVEDSGECFVAFEDPEEPEGVRLMDLTFLNELIQSELSRAHIEIIPM